MRELLSEPVVVSGFDVASRELGADVAAALDEVLERAQLT